jgi:hypothetical protein
MAFAIRNLSVLAYANGFTLWHYRAGRDPLEQVETQDFFADAADMLAEGDMMLVSASDGGGVPCALRRGRGSDREARLSLREPGPAAAARRARGNAGRPR